MNTDAEAARRRRVRRSAILLALLAAAVFVLYIALAIRQGSRG